MGDPTLSQLIEEIKLLRESVKRIEQRFIAEDERVLRLGEIIGSLEINEGLLSSDSALKAAKDCAQKADAASLRAFDNLNSHFSECYLQDDLPTVGGDTFLTSQKARQASPKKAPQSSCFRRLVSSVLGKLNRIGTLMRALLK